jgi:di-trans,poly-cis-decaprenylcistransferase
LDKVENESKDGKGGIFNVALNYGGRAEMVRAAKLLSESGKEFNEENFSHFLYTSDQPDPDIIIRTGGEKRLSNFLLYQSAYSELFFVDTLWPDFSNQELDSIIAQYGERDRRYGKV